MTDTESSVETPVVETPVVETPEVKAQPPNKVDEDSLAKMQKRIDRLTWELRERDRQVQPESKTPASETLKPLTREDVGFDEDKFIEEVAARKAREVLAAERQKATTEEKQRTFLTRQEEFIKTHPDYSEKVIEGARIGSWACTTEMAEVILESEIAPEITYYLAENEEKAMQIAQLSPFQQAREIGRIEAKLEAEKIKPVVAPPVVISKAPPPSPKIEANDSAPSKAWNDPALSQAEFNKRRRQQIAARR
jgi:hypothetical protein